MLPAAGPIDQWPVAEATVTPRWHQMRDHLHPFLRDLGLLLHVPAVLAVATVPVALLAGEPVALVPLVALIGLAVGVGQGLYRWGRGAQPGPLWVSLAVVALAWLLTALLCTLPFIGVALLSDTAQVGSAAVFSDPLSAFFESMSGVTSTGLTMVDRESELPTTLQWWRSLLQWVGGSGVVVLALAVVHPASSSLALFRAEGRDQRLTVDMQSTATRIAAIYGGLTVAAGLGFLAVGMAPWEALNHGMTGIATGGFTVTDDSFASYGDGIKIVGLAIIATGTVSFTALHMLVAHRELRRLRCDSELRLLALLLVGGAVLVVAADAAAPVDVPTVDVVFQWVSAQGTAGFQSGQLSTWSRATIFILILGMVVGGSAGSTTGGIKVARLAWLLKSTVARFRTVEEPEGDATHYHWNGHPVARGDAVTRVGGAASLVTLWLLTLALGTVALLLATGERLPFEEVLFEAASALGNVGLSTLTTADLGGTAKSVLVVLMWTGRLEILGVLVLLTAPVFARPRAAARPSESEEYDQSTTQADEPTAGRP